MNLFRILTCYLWLSVCVFSTFGQENSSLFRDTTDNRFDLSTWLLELQGFVPIVSPITEPAVGYGLASAAAVFIPKKGTEGKFRMPDIVAGGAGWTQNGTWFTGGGYVGFWNDDQIRYRGIAGYGSINLQYFGLISDVPTEFTINSSFFLQQGLFRIKESNYMLGGKYVLANTRIKRFEDDLGNAEESRDFDLVNSGIGFIAEFENFNFVLSPTAGLRFHIEYTQFMEALGSDRNYSRVTFFGIGYLPLNPRWNSGFRIEFNIASEGTPFYAKPYLALRGLPALRYQGDWTLLAETEQFINVYGRWSAVAFGGYGKAFHFKNTLKEEESAWNAGAGFRYLLARVLHLQMGVDVARGPEDWAFYVVFGNSWMK
jgi:hypothetical protein